MEPITPSRRATFDLPKPETGLAEWTSKIKALQRQVDADEEAEQKRLEEEIASARRARFRRSQGAGYGDDSESTASPSALGVSSSGISKFPSSEQLKSSFDRKKDRDDALRKLTENSSRNVDNSSITQGILPRSSRFPASQPPSSQPPSSQPPSSQSPSSQRQEPVSLASFMGGRATGPRLNRHAPQQNAHDPTQFEQRKVDAPHPIFGKGGIAMPGMVTKPGASARDAVNASEAIERYHPRLPMHSGNSSATKPLQMTPSPRPISPQKSGSRDRKNSSPSVARKSVEQLNQRPTSPQKVAGRERTLSTPGSSPKELFHSRRTITHSTSTEGAIADRPRNPHKDQLASTPSRSSTPFKQPTERPNISRQSLPSPVKSPVSTPSLARPVLPEPRSSFQTPIITASSVPSPAFNKGSPSKDPTPSISRLQGRGFVQNMVRASSQLETPTRSTSSPPITRPTNARKSAVLDRWQPTSASTSTSPASVPRQTSPVRKAFSEIAVKADAYKKSPASSPATPPQSGKVLQTKRSHGLLHPDPLSPPEPLSPRRAKMAEKMLPPEGSPGFGSATTMVVYKPKTPEPEGSPPTVSVDELGVRRDTGPDNKGKPRFSTPSELPHPNGKPLNHPTKDRARKPKKTRDASGQLPPHTKPIPEQVGKIQPLREPTLPLPHSPQLPRTPSPKSFNGPSLNIEKVSSVGAVESSSTTGPSSKVAHITQMWGPNAPIGIKPIAVPSFQAQAQAYRHEVGARTDPHLIRRALPGLAATDNLRAPPPANKSKSPSPESTAKGPNNGKPTGSSQDISPSGTSDYTSSPGSTEGQTKPSGLAKSDKRPISPSSPKHKRIPSTGNRALVMDVAQALSDYNANLDFESINSQEEIKSPVVESTPEPMIKPAVPSTSEKRRSSHDRFSLVSVMPPLKEEVTPSGTPFGTLTRTSDTLSQTIPPEKDVSAVEEKGPRRGKNDQENVVLFDVDHAPLPTVDVHALLDSRIKAPLVLPDAKTISVDVFAINGVSSTIISQDADIFYDTEMLAIVHRFKSKTSGLVSTQLWVWHGRNSNTGEKEERKLKELAKRYNTSPVPIYQASEPAQLVQLLGGQLIIRQGNRLHWSADNTAMYSVRRLGGVIYIDEHDLSVKNLCSAFSYCLNILDTVYVWHGCGSTESERQAAVQYSSRIAKGGSPAIQLHEGEDDADDLFWMALGDDEYARADYWRWRRQTSEVDPRIWRVDAKADPPVSAILSLKEESARTRSVYILDCIWEFFVMVGHEARGDRRNIKLGLRTAKRLAETSAVTKPFTPTVHVLVLPSRLPLDLRLNLREMDDTELNNREIPDHMNLLSAAQAENHLQQHTWERIALRDQTMLPLGVSANTG